MTAIKNINEKMNGIGNTAMVHQNPFFYHMELECNLD